MISAVGIKRILFADIDKVTADITPEICTLQIYTPHFYVI